MSDIDGQCEFHAFAAKLSVALLCAAAFFCALTVPQKVRAQETEGVTTTKPLWVKLCSNVAGANASLSSANSRVCLEAHHERLDRQTGMVLVSVGIRKVQNMDKPLLLIMVPLGMAIKPGLEIKFDSEAKGMQVPFATCHFAGCTAEIVATPDIIQKMKSGRTMTVGAVNHVGRRLVFPVPLNGFTKAYDGPAGDLAQFTEERRTLIKRLREPLYSLDRMVPTSGIPQ